MALFRFALSIIFRHKLRTFLTSLGITISVVLLSFIIFGMQDLRSLLVDEFTSRFDPNEVLVTKFDIGFLSGSGSQTDETEEVKEQTIISQELIDDLVRENDVESVDPQIIITGMDIYIEGEEIPFSPAFVGGIDVNADDSYFPGGYEGSIDKDTGEAFISKNVLDSFGLTFADVEGTFITLEPSTATIFASKSKNTVDKQYQFEIVSLIDPGTDRIDVVLNVDDALDVLVDAGGFIDGEEYLNTVGYDQVSIIVKEGKVDEFKTVLEEDYNLTPFTADDFLEFLDIITVGITVVLVLFGVVSSVVASIGIINTMVMSIYEQTKEIGLNKAIGASNFQIMLIYLIQSGAIGFIGSFLGLIIIFGGMTLSDGFIVKELENIGFTTDSFFHFDWSTAMIIILASIVVGIIAGLYPALKAARLDPVKALRFD
ncbi:ABC transporter permease [Candidatus Dojkabacteria bacterium]|uniref:ABC transporter permease n=1 Tax=Candidatus Dojkabacteria bacterium TaxID=2099670 RepID=A0A955L4T5_9BACT|nr:ABC transporter permease [Candidatus Dojkabacteria bacterium]